MIYIYSNFCIHDQGLQENLFCSGKNSVSLVMKKRPAAAGSGEIIFPTLSDDWFIIRGPVYHRGPGTQTVLNLTCWDQTRWQSPAVACACHQGWIWDWATETASHPDPETISQRASSHWPEYTSSLRWIEYFTRNNNFNSCWFSSRISWCLTRSCGRQGHQGGTECCAGPEAGLRSELWQTEIYTAAVFIKWHGHPQL